MPQRRFERAAAIHAQRPEAVAEAGDGEARVGGGTKTFKQQRAPCAMPLTLDASVGICLEPVRMRDRSRRSRAQRSDKSLDRFGKQLRIDIEIDDELLRSMR